MKGIYLAELDVAKALASASDKLVYATSVLRSLMQTVSVTALSVAMDVDDNPDLADLARRFQKPADGLPIEVLDRVIPILRAQVSRTFLSGWYPNELPGKSLSATMLEWVSYRNSRAGHGVLDEPISVEWSAKTIDLISQVLAIAPECLPLQGPGGMVARVGADAFFLKVPLIRDGRALVITKVASRLGVWKLYAQTLSWTASLEVVADLDAINLFSEVREPIERFRLADVRANGRNHLIFSNLPVRQTSTFVGRAKELDKLSNWLVEVNDSARCLVFGDGGFGKTTLVLEFLNRILDGEVSYEAVPSLICFYTAKKTKWTEDGLIHFKGVSSAYEDCLRELVYCFHSVLGKEWFGLTGRPLIDKVSTELASQGFRRNDVLMVIDNTETLAAVTGDAEELGTFLTDVSRKVGRLIITSRRREMIEATPVPVERLPPEDALTLIKRLGDEYRAKAVRDSGERNLRKACEQLGSKPLLIDTLVRYLARSDKGLQHGLDHVLTQTDDQLLEFLYEDAWQRMSMLVQDVFLVLVSVATPIDGRCVGDACSLIGVSHSEFQSSLSETYFASTVDRGENYDLEVVGLAEKFFLKKKGALSVDDHARVNEVAGKVDKRAAERHEIEKAYRTDRVADAFRSEYAKAAKIHAFRGELRQANSFYELAIAEDPLNASLRERYSSFLFRQYRDAREARIHAEEALRLDPRSADAWLTSALIFYQENAISEGDEAIDNAKRCGKPESLCALRKAIARFHYVKINPEKERAIAILDEAEVLVERSLQVASPGEDFYMRNRTEAERYRVRIQCKRREILRFYSAHQIGS